MVASSLPSNPPSATFAPPLGPNGLASAVSSVPPRPLTFHQRPLPATCIPFTSAQSKALFASTLSQGTLDAFFPLSSQFLTQNEPTFCGLGTLCMILNALGVDPQRRWKGVWRWYEQGMLDCCRPVTAVEKEGLTFAEFCCLGRCNGLNVEAYSPPSPTLTPEQREVGLARFRRDLKRSTTTSSTFMAASFSRRALGQTGDGHFSPIGGYAESEDLALVLDVARFKYPSYWIPVPVLFDSMCPVDKATNKPRGYALLSSLSTKASLQLPGCEVDGIPPDQTLTTLTLHKASWALLSRDISAAILKRSGEASVDELIGSVATVAENLITPAVALRPPPEEQQESEEALAEKHAIVSVTLAFPNTEVTNPFHLLLVLAVFYPGGNSPFLPLLSASLREQVETFVSGIVKKAGRGWRGKSRVCEGRLRPSGSAVLVKGRNVDAHPSNPKGDAKV